MRSRRIIAIFFLQHLRTQTQQPMPSKANPIRLALSLILFLLLSLTARTQVLKGQVLDAKTGEPMSGATIEIKGKNLSHDRKLFVQLDGIFVFRNLPAGEYE